MGLQPAAAQPTTRKVIPRTQIRLSSAINEGGIAHLHDAFDSHGDRVVFRQLHTALKFRLGLQRKFRQGVKIRRQLGEHPHIVKYLGEGGWLLPYEVIEYVPGNSLKRLIYERDPTIQTFPMAILQQLAEAMAYVHQAGWLHLDIKPENIMIIWDGKAIHLKLTDFDMCLPITMTRAPRLAGGSLAYLPPEFLQSKEVSISTDVFAFGVLAINLFTGQAPFVGSVQNIMDAGSYEILYPTTQAGEVPLAVRDFISRCLAPEPCRRFCDDSELAKGLKVLASKLDAPSGRMARPGSG